jgi:hypothetical protein
LHAHWYPSALLAQTPSFLQGLVSHALGLVGAFVWAFVGAFVGAFVEASVAGIFVGVVVPPFGSQVRPNFFVFGPGAKPSSSQSFSQIPFFRYIKLPQRVQT